MYLRNIEESLAAWLPPARTGVSRRDFLRFTTIAGVTGTRTRARAGSRTTGGIEQPIGRGYLVRVDISRRTMPGCGRSVQ